MRFTALDSWRGVCALMVALYHAPIEAGLRNNALVGNGYLYVDFFFVLSGFVITHAWGKRITDGISASGFLLRRWGRLWPLHAATLAFLLALECAKWAAGLVGLWHGGAFLGGNTGWTVLTNLLLVHAWGLHQGIYWNFPSWSISTEWAAYIVFAGVMLVAGRSWALAMCVAGLAATAAFLWLSPATIDATFNYGVLRCISAFALGVATWHVWKRIDHLPNAVASLLQALALIAVAASVILCGKGPASHIVPVPFALAVFAFAFPSGLPARALAVPPLRALGDWSYSIYLNHIGLIMVMKMAATLGTVLFAPSWLHMREDTLVFSSPVLANLAVIGFALLLVGVSALTYRWIELPAQAWFNRQAVTRFSPARLSPGT
jgi:hypothetical protein